MKVTYTTAITLHQFQGQKVTRPTNAETESVLIYLPNGKAYELGTDGARRRICVFIGYTLAWFARSI